MDATDTLHRDMVRLATLNFDVIGAKNPVNKVKGGLLGLNMGRNVHSFLMVGDEGLIACAAFASGMKAILKQADRIDELLAPESKPLWDALRLIKDRNGLDHWLQLSFMGEGNRILPSASLVFWLGNNLGLYSVFGTDYDDIPITSIPQSDEFSMAERLMAYITENLDAPLPKVRVLAREFGTNEHSINDRFRERYGIPIYRFYSQERLRRALLLIKESDLPLKSIAAACGYQTYSVFSKAFRKVYGRSAVSFRGRGK